MKTIKKLLSLVLFLGILFGTIAWAKPALPQNTESPYTDDVLGNTDDVLGNTDGSTSANNGTNSSNNNTTANTSNIDALALDIALPGNGSGVSQYSTPTINIYITNKTKQVLNGSNLAAGFISCMWKEQALVVYQSNSISQLTIDAGSQLKKAVSLKNLLTQGLGDKTIVCKINKWSGEGLVTNNAAEMKIAVVSASRFDLAISKAVSPINENLDAPEIKKGKEGVVDFLMTKVIDVLIPLIILVSILTAILGFYKLFFSSDDKSIGTGTKLIAFGVIGIVLMMSAKFFANTIYSDIFLSGDIGYGKLQGYELAQKLYENLLFPFLKIAIYLSLGVLFVMLVSRVIGFVFGDDDTKKKAGTIITWNVIGMLVIIGSKQIVEFIYGKQADVVRSVSNLGDIGSGLLADKNFPFLYQVINRAMGFASLVILIMVLWQAFQLLMKPDAPDAMKKIKNSLLYIFIGIVIIGAGYIITNFLIIN